MDDMERTSQKFEEYPALAVFIRAMANNGTGLSNYEWSEFLMELNAALETPQSLREENERLRGENEKALDLIKQLRMNYQGLLLTCTEHYPEMISQFIPDFMVLDNAESFLNQSLTPVIKELMTEKIICAAIWYKEQPSKPHQPHNVDKGIVVSGYSHAQCIGTFTALTGKRSVFADIGESVQGFLTNKNRFVDRKEAMKIALAAKQVPKYNDIHSDSLYSENLYRSSLNPHP